MKTVSYLTIVPNDSFGQNIIKQIRQMAKKNGWIVVCRGRCADRVAVAKSLVKKTHDNYRAIHARFRQSVPLKYSDRVAVYVRAKDSNGWTVNITPNKLATMIDVTKV